MQHGYDQFRRVVNAANPNYFARTQQITVSTTTRSLDLTTTSPKLAGSSAGAGTKIARLNAINVVSTEDKYSYSLTPCTSFDDLSYQGTSYFFNGEVVYFPLDFSGRLQFVYIPTQNISWSSDSAYVDGLEEFHDLIPLYAYQFYAIRDAASNQQVLQMIAKRELELQQFFGHSVEGERVVYLGF